MKKVYLLSFLLLTLILVSCTMENNVDDYDLNVSGDNSELVERSESISDIVVEEFGIDDATTIVFNEYSIIAVKIAYNEDISQEHTEKITNKVLNYDRQVEEVLITDDSRTFKDIDNIVFDLLQGSDYKDYLDDINGIFNRL